MNLLLVTFSFPPAGGVGVLRAVSLAKYLPENDIRVDVLTARNAPSVGKDLTLLQSVPTTVTIHRTWTLDLPFAVRKTFKKLLAGRQATRPANANPATTQPAATTTPARPNPLKRFIADLLLPDPQVGWLPFALPAARRIIRQRHIDAVLVTVPPFSSVKLVTQLRRHFPTLPIVLDFRDEWLTTTIHLVSFNNNQKARDVAAKAESEAVRDATLVVTVTEAAARELRRRYPNQPPEKFQCLPNGFDTAAPTAPLPTTSLPAKPLPETRPTGPTLFTYIGTVYGSTDPTTLVQAVHRLPPAVRQNLKLRFIGHIETPAYRDLLLSLGDTVELKGFVPQAEALGAIDDTTYLLLVTHDPINVAAKLYDYLGGGKPILAAVHPDGDVRRLLEETRAGWWADIDNIDAIADALTQAVARRATLPHDFQPDTARIAGYHRRPLARRYAALLRTLPRSGNAV